MTVRCRAPKNSHQKELLAGLQELGVTPTITTNTIAAELHCDELDPKGVKLILLFERCAEHAIKVESAN